MAIVELSCKANANINECGVHKQTHTQVYKNMEVGQHNALLSFILSVFLSLSPALAICTLLLQFSHFFFCFSLCTDSASLFNL